MDKKPWGFTIMELMIVLAIMILIIIFAIPNAYQAVKGYRLHSDAAGIAQQLNFARLRATSQFTPFRLNLVPSTTALNTYTMERLCGTSASCASVTAGCTQSYMPLNPAVVEFGVQNIGVGDQFTTTNPGGTSAYPGSIVAGTSASAQTGATTTFYFSTRGLPANCDGTPLLNGGEVIYITNGTLTDAVAISTAGRITTYSWVPSSNSWYQR